MDKKADKGILDPPMNLLFQPFQGLLYTVFRCLFDNEQNKVKFQIDYY
jgi:hypothetical protein